MNGASASFSLIGVGVIEFGHCLEFRLDVSAIKLRDSTGISGQLIRRIPIVIGCLRSSALSVAKLTFCPNACTVASMAISIIAFIMLI